MTRILPDGCIDVVFSPGRGLRLIGANTVAFRSDVEPGEPVIGARLLPGAAPALLGIAAEPVLDQRPPLSDLLGDDARRLQARLYESADRVGTLREWLTERARQACAPDPVVAATVVWNGRHRSSGRPGGGRARDLGAGAAPSCHRRRRLRAQAAGAGAATCAGRWPWPVPGRRWRTPPTRRAMPTRRISATTVSSWPASRLAVSYKTRLPDRATRQTHEQRHHPTDARLDDRLRRGSRRRQRLLRAGLRPATRIRRARRQLRPARHRPDEAGVRRLLAGGGQLPGRRGAPDAARPGNVELALVSPDVDGATAHAIEAGCTSLADPIDKPHGQRVAYVRDPFGTLVEIASPL